MTSKLPWTTAAILLVAAVAVGAWAIWGAAPAEPTPTPPTPPAPGPATITGSLGPGTVFGAAGDNMCIENIYIVRAGQDYNDNFSGLSTDDNLWGVISSSGGEFATMTYDSDFAIVVAVTGHTDNMGSTTMAYMKVALGAYTDSDDWRISFENSENESLFLDSSPTYIRVNVAWDNNGNYYQLSADDNLIIENIDLYGRY